jgi:intracellular multiplication protein IcmL
MSESRDLDKELRLLLGKPDVTTVWDKGLTGPSNIILDRNKSLRGLVVFLIGITVVAMLTAVSLGYSVVSLANRDLVELAYGIDEDNRIYELSQTKLPHLTDADAMERAARLVKKLHKYSSSDWQLQVDSYERDFINSNAHSRFVQALDNSQVIIAINQGVKLTWAELKGAAQITKKSKDGRKWEIQVPFTWFIGGGTEISKGSSFVAYLTLEVVPRSRNSHGLAISSYSDKPVKGHKQ